MRFPVPAGGTLALWLAFTTPAYAFDLHRFWDAQCQGCHGHSADFARAELAKNPPPAERLAGFIAGHRGGVDPRLAAAIAAMLTAQANQPADFREHCRVCHGDAASLARNLIRRDGGLYGRYSGRALREFLESHARLDADGAEAFARLMERVEAEVHFAEVE
ncbi:MAG: hypothetical protein H3C38_07910 [Rhodospirillales bacterium]|nr:hypothetical protein [Rhodospirillales bacterium]